MKTTMIARCVFAGAAIFAAAGLIGCGAEGQGSEAEGVGATSEALTATPVKLTGSDDPTDLTGSQSPAQERWLASSCRMRDATSGVEYFVIAGGFDDGTPTPKSDILLATANNAFVKQTATLTVARGDGKMIAVSDTECWFVGGATSPGAAVAKVTVDVLKLVHGTPDTISVNAGITPHTLNQARSNHQLSICVDSSGAKHVVAFAGLQGGTAMDDIEVSPQIASIGTTNWTRYATKLSTPRYNFGLAKEKTTNKYLVAAGNTGLSPHDNTLDLVTMTASSTDCVPSSHVAATNLPDALEGNVAFPESNADTFQVTAGRYLVTGTETLYPLGKKVTVTNWATGAVTIAAGSAPVAGAYRPVLVETDPTNHGSWALLGGSNAAITAGVATVQHFVTGSGFAAAATGLVPPAGTGIYGGVAEYFPNTAPKNAGTPNGILIHATGKDFVTTLPLTVEAWK